MCLKLLLPTIDLDKSECGVPSNLISVASLWENAEPQSSTILEDEKRYFFLLERAWQVLQKKTYLKN